MRIAVILYKSNTLASGEHPLMIRVACKKAKKLVSLGISCPASLWNSDKNEPKRNHPHKKRIEQLIAKKLAQYHTKYLELEEENKPLSPEALIKAVENTRAAMQLFPFLDELIDRLMKSGKISTADTYKTTRSTLRQFTSKQLLFTDIDHRFLSKYETYLIERGLVNNTIADRFTTLATIINKAIQEQLLKKEYDPFKDFKILKRTATQKRAIGKEDVKKLAQLPIAPESTLYNAQQYFLFSYYGSGMNFRDMAFLKWGDIEKGRVSYTRAKTGKLIQFKLLAPAQAIVDYYRPQRAYNKEEYIFPMLNKHVHRTPIDIHHRLKNVLNQFNKGLKELASLAGININLTTYVARHTYATVLKMSEVDADKISEAMGHSNPRITQIYLKGFANELIDETDQYLLLDD